MAVAGIEASVTGHEHRRLQDVSTAPVVLETAIIKVHRQAKRLEIESHCKKPWDNVGTMKMRSYSGGNFFFYRNKIENA